MIKLKETAFTLVELIVVITILAILGTIAFISLQGYSREARDSKRLADVRNLVGKISIEHTKGTPYDDLISNTKPINLIIDGTGAISNIGKANFVNLKELESNFKDPSNDTIDYPIAYSIGGIGTGAYSFVQAATINEVKNEAVLVGRYYQMQEGDAPSLFKSGALDIVDGGSVLPYNPGIGGNNEEDIDPIPEGVCPENPNPPEDFLFSNGNITSYVGESKNVVIPCKIGNQKVTGLNGWSFSTRELESVVLSGYISTIGGGVFYDNNIKNIILPDSVTIIGASAFQSESEGGMLENINIPSGVTFIGNLAFSNNKLTNIEIPDSVTSLGESAFAINNLTSVKIGNGITSIQKNTFQDNNLSTIEIPTSVTSIGNYAFQRAFNENITTHVEIPANVITIGEGAFHNNKINSIKLSEGLTSIGNYGFQYNSLISVQLPNTLTSLGNYSFGSNDIENVSIGNTINNIPSGAFFTNRIKDITIPTNVTIIKDNAFNKNKLENIYLHDNIINIENWSFTGQTPASQRGKIYGPTNIKTQFYINTIFQTSIYDWID